MALGADARAGRGAHIGAVSEFTTAHTALIGVAVGFAANKCSVDTHVERHVGAVEGDGRRVGHTEHASFQYLGSCCCDECEELLGRGAGIYALYDATTSARRVLKIRRDFVVGGAQVNAGKFA